MPVAVVAVDRKVVDNLGKATNHDDCADRGLQVATKR